MATDTVVTRGLQDTLDRLVNLRLIVKDLLDATTWMESDDDDERPS